MQSNRAPQHEERDPRFPPMVRFKVFLESVVQLSEAKPESRQRILDGLSDNDRSQLLRTLSLFEIRSEDGRYNELTLRRLADPARRQAAMVELIQAHFPDELAAISTGVTREELEDLLAVPERNSASARQKARQFLERAMEEARLSTEAIRTAHRHHSTHDNKGVDESGSRSRHGARERFIAQQQQYLDQLLERHARADVKEAARLEAILEKVSQRVVRLLKEL